MAAFHRGCIPVLGTLVIYACSSTTPKPVTSGSAGAGGQSATAGAAGTSAGDAGAGAAGAADAGSAGAIGAAGAMAVVDGGGAGATEAGASTDGATFPIGDPGTDGDGDLMISPPYATQPDLTDKGNPKGKSFHFTMSSADSQIFKGADTTLLAANQHSFTRGVDVYVPALYQDGTPAPLLVIQDGPGELGLVKNALDNLTISKDATRKLPVFVVVAIANGGGDSKGSERGLEYDTMSDRYARFVQTEVLPAVIADAGVKAAFPHLTFTDNPEGKATLGCSSGGAAALTMGWFRPDLFHRVITYSGTFVAQQNDTAPEQAMFPDGAWDYHTNLDLIMNSPQKPLRVFLNCNQMDNGATAPASGAHNWVIANQRTAAALKAQDYHYRFIYAMQAGHCDGTVQNATLADTLVWTWRGFPAP
ncbi:MAG TPA: alpha/beta hydrolase-fold protein [Polyangia bacterium]|jgi:enterochelin esterase-like enzyme|nr:alpha/beta hydrolase-fold protein [Polyangia bacterium]